MARPKPRSRRPEENIVRRRIRYELRAQNLSHRKLAREMAKVGQPVSPSWVSKVLAHDHPQNLTVNELGALMEVLGIRVEDMLSERSEDLSAKANLVLAALSDAKKKLGDGGSALEEAIGDAASLIEEGQDFSERATDVIADYERATDALVDMYLDAVDQAYGIDMLVDGKYPS
jgi:transcriptional regulator with XRE-family HTH domain